MDSLRSIGRFAKRLLKPILPKVLYLLARKIFLYLSFVRDFVSYRKVSAADSRFLLSWEDRYPCIYDRTATTGFDPHYLYHPAWAARILAKRVPNLHIDISSTLNFCTVVSAFLRVEFYDYRPARIRLGNLASREGNLLKLPFEDNSVESLSCMHVVEHIGLGRYGEPIDPRGDMKAMDELKRVLAVGGDFLFVTPVGIPRLMFNAHRIYSYDQIISQFAELELKEFSLIPDNASEVGMIRNAPQELVNRQAYGCGCFWFTKSGLAS